MIQELRCPGSVLECAPRPGEPDTVVPSVAGALIVDRRGGALLEYIIVLGVVALLGIHAFQVFGADASKAVHDQGADVAKMGF